MKKGYTLLEVLVAIVIISSSVVAVFEIFSLGFKNFAKLHDYEKMYIALTNEMEEINAIDDFETNKAKQGTMGEYDYEWQASPETPPLPTTAAGGEPGPYDIILYKITLKISHASKSGSGIAKEFTLYKIGWIAGKR